MSDQVIVDLFNETALREKPLGGIMGNEEYDAFEREEIKKLLLSLDLETRGKILDAGAGIGRNTPILKELGFTDITAADFSHEMLKVLKNNHPDVKTHEVDLLDLSRFSDNYFDITFCMYVFIHITNDDDLAQAISELERVTSGPLIIGQVMDAENKPQHRVCKVREYFEMHPYFKKKQLDHFYKNLYEFPAPDNSAINRISFAIYR
jgi:ubiquinone/menaquinone biosynthesis C-methylase UbiE